MGFPPIHGSRAAQCAAPTCILKPSFFIVGAGHWPARIRGASRRPRPTAQHRLHLLGQARRGSGTAPAPIFHIARAQWPGGNLERHSDFARRKFCTTSQVRVPRNGGSRGRATWRQGGFAEPADCAHPLASFGSFSTRKRNSPRRAKPCKTARRVVAQASFSCPFGAIHLLAPYGKRNQRSLQKRRSPIRGQRSVRQIILRSTEAPGRR